MKVARILRVNGGSGRRAKILRHVNHMIVAIEGIILPMAGVMNAEQVSTKTIKATTPALQTRIASLGNTGMEEAPLPPQPARTAQTIISRRHLSPANVASMLTAPLVSTVLAIVAAMARGLYAASAAT